MRRAIRNQIHPPAIDDGDVGLFILTNNTKAVSFKIESHSRSTGGSRHWPGRSRGIRGSLLFKRGWDNQGRGDILRADGWDWLVGIVGSFQSLIALSELGIRGGFRGHVGPLRFWI